VNATRHADQHVLRIPHDGHRTPRVGRERDREQEGQRPEAERLQRRDDQRREDETDGVVDEQRRQQSAESNDRRQECPWRPHPLHDVRGRPLEESAELEIAGEQQHPEQEGDDVEIDGGVRLA
jgi:hypothetical protein